MNMSGSFDGTNIYRCTSTALEHDVILAGYDDAGGYWIVKNSWGATWGPDSAGYFKVGYGECAIESLVTYATYAQPVGGIAELPDVAQPSLETAASSSGSSAPPYAAIAGAAAAAALALTVSGWYARRRLS